MLLVALAAAAQSQPAGAAPSASRLAHVNLTAISSGVPSVLVWWCEEQHHSAEPLCARNELSKQIARARGDDERRDLLQRRQRLLRATGQAELERAMTAALRAYCDAAKSGGGGAPAVCAAGNSSGSMSMLTRAEQIVQVNSWWCAEPARNGSLACRRHELQQKFLLAAGKAEREVVGRALGTLLGEAGTAALAGMHEEVQGMLRAFCALPASLNLEVCTTAGSLGSNRRALKGKGGMRRGGGGGGGGGGGRGRPAAAGGHKGVGKHGGGRRGMAVLWTAESLSVLRGWWCADRHHMREARCTRGVRWTRQQPGLSAIRRLFCAEAYAPNSTHALANVPTRLCLGAGMAPLGAVAAGMSAEPFPRHKRHGWMVRGTTVAKLMLALLGLALLAGWKLRLYRVGGGRAKVMHKGEQTGRGHLEVEAVPFGGYASARRRTRAKRPRARDGGLADMAFSV